MTRHQKLNSLIAGIALVMLIALAVVLDHGMGGKTQGGLLARLRKQGFLRVGYADEAPFAYVNPKTGKLTGESPAVLRVVMAKLGIKHLKGVLTNFGSLIPGLEAHRFDIIAAGMYITPARAREVLFSNPTFALGDGFVVRKGNPLDLHTFADAACSAGIRLGVVGGAQEYQYALESGVKPAQISGFPSAPEALAAVEAGRVDAYAGTALTVRRLVRLAHNPDIAVARPFHNPVIHGRTVLGYGAFAFRRRDIRLCRAVNKILAKFVNTKQHLQLVKRFGFTKADLPGTVTAAQIAGPGR